MRRASEKALGLHVGLLAPRAQALLSRISGQQIEPPYPSSGPHIYIFEFDKWVKIGFSTNVAVRLVQLQTMLPFPPEVRLVAPGNRIDESLLHAYFAQFRTNGEWFAVAGHLALWLSEQSKCLT